MAGNQCLSHSGVFVSQCRNCYYENTDFIKEPQSGTKQMVGGLSNILNQNSFFETGFHEVQVSFESLIKPPHPKYEECRKAFQVPPCLQRSSANQTSLCKRLPSVSGGKETLTSSWMGK